MDSTFGDGQPPHVYGGSNHWFQQFTLAHVWLHGTACVRQWPHPGILASAGQLNYMSEPVWWNPAGEGPLPSST